MNYLSAQEIAKKWGIAPRSVVRYAKAGKLDGAKLVGGTWIIPADAVQPQDGRIKNQSALKNNRDKSEETNRNFIFPVYIYSRYYKHKELLSSLEQQLYEAQNLFFAGSYQESYKELQALLPQTETSPLYFRLGCLFYLLVLAIYNEDDTGFKAYITEIDELLKQDFPYKKEMEAYLPILSYYYKGLKEVYTFKLGPTYEYDADALAIIYHNYFTQRILATYEGDLLRKQDIYFFELLVKGMTEECSAAAGVVLTNSILYLSFLCNDNEASKIYMDKTIALAKEGNCPVLLVELLQYVGSPFRKRLKLYDMDLYTKVEKLWQQQLRGCIKIRKSLQLKNDFVQYTEDEIFLIGALAIEHTNVEIAGIIGITPNTVSKRIARLYEKTGLTSRGEFKKLFYEIFL